MKIKSALLLLITWQGIVFADAMDQFAQALKEIKPAKPPLPPRNINEVFKLFPKAKVAFDANKENLGSLQEALSKKLSVAQFLFSCDECLDQLPKLKNKDVTILAKLIAEGNWDKLDVQGMLVRLTNLVTIDPLLEEEIEKSNDKLRKAWQDIKFNNTAGFYRTYINLYSNFFKEHPAGIKKLVNDLQSSIASGKEKLSPAALDNLKRTLKEDIGYFIGRDQYLYSRLNKIPEQIEFVKFLKSEEGKEFREALVLLLRDKSSITVNEVADLLQKQTIDHIIGPKQSPEIRKKILAALHDTLQNAKTALSSPSFYEITEQMQALVQKFQPIDPNFASMLEKQKDFAIFLSSESQEAKNLLSKLEINDEKTKNLRRAIDSDVAKEIARASLTKDGRQEIGSFTGKIDTFNIGQLKQQWPFEEDQENDDDSE